MAGRMATLFRRSRALILTEVCLHFRSSQPISIVMPNRVPPQPSTSTADDENDNAQTSRPELLPVQQDPVERRAIRHRYRQLLQGTLDYQDALIQPESDQLQETLNEANRLFENVKMTREAALDSQLLASLSKLSRKQAQTLQADLVSFEPVEFTEKLKAFLQRQQMAPGAEDTHCVPRDGWEALGKSSQSYFRRTPPLHIMFGSFERGQLKPIAVRERRVKVVDKDAAAGGPTAPKQLKSFDKTDVTEVTTEHVEHVLNTLRTCHRKLKKRPMCYFQFIINPDSFGKTVENMFHTSFLIKDGFARISLDKEKLPVIEPVFETEQEREQNTDERRQVVMSLTKLMWRNLISTFKITKSVIRAPATRRNGVSHSKELARSDSDTDD